MLWKHISLLSLRSYGNPQLKMMDIPIDIFLTLLNKWENRHTMSVIPTSYLAQYTVHFLLRICLFFLYLLYPSSIHLLSSHVHVLSSACHKRISLHQCNYNMYRSIHKAHFLQWHAVSDYQIIPTAEASTLLLPHPFKCWHTPDGSSSLPSFSFPPHLADACQPTLVFSPVFLFLSFYSVSLFAILWFSQKNRDNPGRDRQSSASDREAHRLGNLTADEAQRSF